MFRHFDEGFGGHIGDGGSAFIEAGIPPGGSPAPTPTPTPTPTPREPSERPIKPLHSPPLRKTV